MGMLPSSLVRFWNCARRTAPYIHVLYVECSTACANLASGVLNLDGGVRGVRKSARPPRTAGGEDAGAPPHPSLLV